MKRSAALFLTILMLAAIFFAVGLIKDKKSKKEESKVEGQLSAAFGCLNETNDKVDTSSYTENQCKNYT